MGEKFTPESSSVLSFVVDLVKPFKPHTRTPSNTSSHSRRATPRTPNGPNNSASGGHLQALIQIAWEKGYTPLTFPSLDDKRTAILKARKNGHVVAMKFLPGRRRPLVDENPELLDNDELKIILGLQRLDSPKNHTIQVLHTYYSDDSDSPYGIIVMPWQSLLDEFLHGSPTKAGSLWYQFLEGVCFLHEHGIAHLDLKPRNVLIGYTDESSHPRVSIIDFGISFCVKSEATKVQGYRGTPSWTAPEVGTEDGPQMTYSPILADRWSCGQVLRHIRSFHIIDDISAYLSAQSQLLSHDPSARPPLSQVLNSLQVVHPVKQSGDTDSPSAVQKRRRSSCWCVHLFIMFLALGLYAGPLVNKANQ